MNNLPPREKGAYGPLTKRLVYGELMITVYSIGYLAYMCNRAQRSIRRWESQKVLPKPLFDLKDGRRWYSAAELIGYTRIVRESGIRPGKESLQAMRRTMAVFRMNLKDLFRLNPEKVKTELPQKFSLKDLMSRHRESYWKSKANRLVMEISEKAQKETSQKNKPE